MKNLTSDIAGRGQRTTFSFFINKEINDLNKSLKRILKKNVVSSLFIIGLSSHTCYIIQV
jgi:hypothetical protein